MPGDDRTFAFGEQLLRELERAHRCGTPRGSSPRRTSTPSACRPSSPPRAGPCTARRGASGTWRAISVDALLRAFERRDRRDLHRRERAVVVIALDARQRVDEVLVADHEADAPARHVVALRHREELDRDVARARHLHDRRRLPAVERDVGVGEVVHDVDVVLARERDDPLEERQLDALRRRIGRESRGSASSASG